MGTVTGHTWGLFVATSGDFHMAKDNYLGAHRVLPAELSNVLSAGHSVLDPELTKQGLRTAVYETTECVPPRPLTLPAPLPPQSCRALASGRGRNVT